MPAISTADTAWMLIATALVLVMTPALGFFYGGMVRAKNALNTMMMSYVALGFVGIAWALLGYSLAFSEGGRFLGDLRFAFLRGVGLEAKGTIPHILFASYQGTFAVITAALISGAIVERMRFGPYLTFVSLWCVGVYAPIAHWVWGGGWLGKLGALDFAGGTVVHINAAAAALVVAIVLGTRKDYARQAIIPQNVPFTLLGAGLLWFGWFGFNGGSALGANASAGLAFANTMFAPMATLVVWSLLDLMRTRKTTAIGVADGALFGNVRQLGVQAAAIVATIIYSSVGTFVIIKVIALGFNVRATAREEGIGLDVTQHGEEAYSRGEGAILVTPDRG